MFNGIMMATTAVAAYFWAQATAVGQAEGWAVVIAGFAVAIALQVLTSRP